MDETTTDTETYVIYRHPSNDTNDALYVNGELIQSGGRSAVMRAALDRMGVEFRGTNDHIHSGDYVRELSDVRLNMKNKLQKRAKELEEEGNTIVAALHDIEERYWGPGQ
jgi:hypothetical protein